MLGKVGIDSALHVSKTVLEMLVMRVSSEVHVIFHYSIVRFVLVSSS